MPIAKTVQKTNDHEFDEGLNCILSDLTEDRYGDIVGDAAHPMLGWNISEFRRNPIALFNHQASFPVGSWKDVHVKDGALRGRLVMAPKGSSPRIDELHALLAAGILKGVSVGFKPTESKPRDNGGGMHFLRNTLIETSLVSVPANPSAQAEAETLAAYEAQARKHRDPVAPPFDNTWRGVKLPPLTWRGKKI
jgi:HK97 family phage prohead protease